MKNSTSHSKSAKLFFTAIIAVIMMSCNNNTKVLEAELQKSNHQRDSLLTVTTQHDMAMNSFLKSYNEIQQNLDFIALRGNSIAKNLGNRGETSGSDKQRIDEDIRTIDLMLTENRMKINALNTSIKDYAGKNNQLKKLVQTLNSELLVKDCELYVLGSKLGKLSETAVSF